MDTRHPVEGSFGREFSAICNHWGVMTAWSRKTWKCCEQFVRFFGKTIPLKHSLLRGPRPKYARASPPHWLTLFQISSKSVHFRRSYCRTREDRFCPVEYFPYRPFEPIIIETRHPIDGLFGSEFPAICNHCGDRKSKRGVKWIQYSAEA